jgi:putative FmdB family regulatory protein
MPTYEYSCPSGHHFERMGKMTDKGRAKCPTCGRMATRKISGGAGLVFKGSGFYITDYGKDGKGPRKGVEGGEAKGGEAKGGEAKSGEAKSGEKSAEPKTESSTSGTKKASE